MNVSDRKTERTQFQYEIILPDRRFVAYDRIYINLTDVLRYGYADIDRFF